MSFRWTLFALLVLINLFAYWALRSSVQVFAPEKHRRWVQSAVAMLVLLLNLPLAAFFIRRLDLSLLQMPRWVLEILFYPSTAWLATIIAFLLIAAPLLLLWFSGEVVGSGLRSLRRGLARRRAPASDSRGLVISRRTFVAGGAGLLIPPLYGVAAYGTYDSLDDLEVSPEQQVEIPNLPAAFDGMTIVQLTDLHVGPYIREPQLRYLVEQVNSLRPGLVAITGDVIDRHLSSLPDAVRGLQGIRATHGVFAVLGNHDIYSDQYSFTKQYRGGVRIAEGLATIGIRTLRNETLLLGNGSESLALLGLDWLSPNPNSPGFYSYKKAETRHALGAMTAAVPPEVPKVLLAHHPDTFSDVPPLGISLTLAGHTHGGGQIVVGNINGRPLGVAMLRFKYLSGLYQEGNCSLYVNRGIGYLGIPIRINCPPEISRFRLVRHAATRPS
jgi:predicted MPP superfamily phosphohydrolase